MCNRSFVQLLSKCCWVAVDSTGDTAGALGLFYIKSNNIAAVRSVTTQMKSDGEDGVPSSPQRSDGLDSAILEALLWNRLERNIPFRTRLPQLMALVASHPSRAISGLSLLQSFIDECMFVAGQRTAGELSGAHTGQLLIC